MSRNINSMNKRPHISVVIPVYNEERRIKNLTQIISYLKKQKYLWEVVLINDGSKDRTQDKLNQLKKRRNFTIISYNENLGKGFAVKTGMLSAKGKYRVFLDIDLSTPITEFDKFLPYLDKYDIVIGSRKMKESNVVTRQSLTREVMGRMFTLLSQKVLQVDVSDFTCGFKCFSSKAVKKTFLKQTINGWGFDSEILYIGKITKHSIKEVPVIWRNAPGTKVKFPGAIISSFLELIKIRINSAKGLYD